VIALALTSMILLAAADPALRIRCDLDPPSIILGQPCTLRIAVTPADPAIEIIPPKFSHATLALAGESTTDGSRVLTYRVIASGAGNAPAIPARASLGGVSRASNPIRLEVAPVPSRGRPNTFLGGVGPLRIGIRISPPRITLGQSCELVVTLEGEGAFGSAQAPRVGGGAGLIRSGWRPEAPTTREFAYRWTPDTPGTARLAAVRASWYDPATRQFQTAVSETPAVEVVAPERFRPATADSPPPTAENSAAHQSPILVGAAIALATAILAAGAAAYARRPRGLAARGRQLARRLQADAPPGAIAAAFACLLKGDDPGLALATPTPREAAERAEQLGLGAEWAQALSGLLADCDRARFAPEPGDQPREGLAARARSLLEDARVRTP
jgi:hypothetical protein